MTTVNIPVVLTCADGSTVETAWTGSINGRNQPVVGVPSTQRNRIVKATVLGVEYDLNNYPMFVTDDPEQLIALPIPVPSIPLTPPT